MYTGSMPDIALRQLLEVWWVFLMGGLITALWLFWGEQRWRSLLGSTNMGEVGQTAIDLSSGELTSRGARSKKSIYHYAPTIGITICIIIGLGRAWQMMWIGDDAFISMRYSEMFARGEGLVFNQGEWVEGYTNFLWTLLLGLLGSIGLPLPQSAIIGDLLSFAGVTWMTHKICTHVNLSILPAVVMSASYPCVVFATSGLETMPAAYLMLCGVYLLLIDRPLLSGLGFIASALMRPDHLLFWGCGGLSLLLTHLYQHSGPLRKRLRWEIYTRYSTPLIAIYLPYFFWRMNAYGHVFPNTYYAKSGNLTYWSQGALYLSSFLIGSGIWWILLTLLVTMIARLWKRGNTHSFHTHVEERAQGQVTLIIFSVLSILIFTTYVVKVGGDFMLYRFFIVLIPLFWFLICSLPNSRWSRLSLVIAVGLAISPIQLVKPFRKMWGLAAEESFYRVKSFTPLKLRSKYAIAGQVLNLLNQETKSTLRVAVDCVGMIGFYGDVRVFDLFGLTSPRVAHKPLKKRGRPGHEKFGTLRDALTEKSSLSTVDLWRRAGYKRYNAFIHFRIRGIKFYFLKYDNEVYQALQRLKERGEKVILPHSIKSATAKILLQSQEGPNPRLLQFVTYFYGEEIKHHTELSQAVEALKIAKKPKPTLQRSAKSDIDHEGNSTTQSEDQDTEGSITNVKEKGEVKPTDPKPTSKVKLKTRRSQKNKKRSTKKRSTKKRSTKKRSTKKRSIKKRSTKKRSTKK